MAVTHNEIQVTWSSSNSVSVSAGATQESDAVTINGAAIDAMVTLKADNNGTPASGDVVDFYALYSTGDPDGASTDEYDTVGEFLCTLNTHSATGGTDPALQTVRLPIAAKSLKIRAVNRAASNAITCSSGIIEVRA